jgi:SAM-dependent methyltransferase
MPTAEFYDDRWPKEEFINWGRFNFTTKILPQFQNPKQKILDLGSGVGHFSRFWVSKGLFGKEEITCCDFSSLGVKSCQDDGFKGFVWNIEQSPTPEAWDLIFFLECLEHVFQPKEVLKNIRESLRPGGFLVLSTPNFVHLYWRLRCLLGFGHEPPGNGHISLFTPQLSVQFIENAGLRVEKQLYITRLAMFRSPGRMLSRIKKSLNPESFYTNDINYRETPFWESLFGEIMIFLCRRG